MVRFRKPRAEPRRCSLYVARVSEPGGGQETVARRAYLRRPQVVEASDPGGGAEKRAADILAYFDRPGTSNGPTEAINGRLEHLRGSALGFRNLTNYIARSLLETGGFRPQLHPRL